MTRPRTSLRRPCTRARMRSPTCSSSITERRDSIVPSALRVRRVKNFANTFSRRTWAFPAVIGIHGAGKRARSSACGNPVRCLFGGVPGEDSPAPVAALPPGAAGQGAPAAPQRDAAVETLVIRGAAADAVCVVRPVGHESPQAAWGASRHDLQPAVSGRLDQRPLFSAPQAGGTFRDRYRAQRS